jgi:hypothetical protein
MRLTSNYQRKSSKLASSFEAEVLLPETTMLVCNNGVLWFKHTLVAIKSHSVEYMRIFAFYWALNSSADL